MTKLQASGSDRNSVKITVLADTHLKCDVTTALPAPALASMRTTDLILHAGDITSLAAFREFQAIRPTYAVLGNNDQELRALLQETLVIDIDGITIAMIHDAGARKGRAERLFRRFPTADIVIFGHSHVPCNEVGLNGQILLNPGSPTQRRAQPSHTIATLVINRGAIRSHEIEIV